MKPDSPMPKRIAALICGAALCALPAAAQADPGTPGVHSAGAVTYAQPQGPAVLGEQQQTPTTTPSTTPASTPTPAVAGATTPSTSSGGSGITSLPFTGLLAGLVLGCGLLLLGVGTFLRFVVRPREGRG
jgi:hypothetical protein